MKYTSAEANKLLKSLYAEEGLILSDEETSCKFNAAVGEDPEKIRPEYSFAETTSSLHEVQRKIRIVKHAINLFNVQTEVPGTDMTIDQVLVEMPKLTARQKQLRQMVKMQERERVHNGFIRSSSIIDYVIRNFDREEVRAEYDKVTKTLDDMRNSLDIVNSTVREIEINL